MNHNQYSGFFQGKRRGPHLRARHWDDTKLTTIVVGVAWGWASENHITVCDSEQLEHGRNKQPGQEQENNNETNNWQQQNKNNDNITAISARFIHWMIALHHIGYTEFLIGYCVPGQPQAQPMRKILAWIDWSLQIQGLTNQTLFLANVNMSYLNCCRCPLICQSHFGRVHGSLEKGFYHDARGIYACFAQSPLRILCGLVAQAVLKAESVGQSASEGRRTSETAKNTHTHTYMHIEM